MKYGGDGPAHEFSHARDYVRINQAAVREMHRQVGDLVLDDEGMARRGLLVRHLLLPGGMSGTDTVLRFLAREVSRDTYLNLMGQYRPCHRAGRYPGLDRPVTCAKLSEALALARRHGRHRLDAGSF